MLRTIVSFILLVVAGSQAAEEDFDKAKIGDFSKWESGVGTWTADPRHAAIHSGNSRSGAQSLRLLGGERRQLMMTPTSPLAGDTELTFWAERWTRSEPFQFRIEARKSGDWSEIYNGDRTLKVGGFHAHVTVPIGKGVEAIRFVSTTPEGSGVMVDDLTLGPVLPMKVMSMEVVQPVIPVLLRVKDNPVAALRIVTEGNGAPVKLTALKISLDGTTKLSDVKAIRVIHTTSGYDLEHGTIFGGERTPSDPLLFTGEQSLSVGENYFWVSVELKDGADIDGRVDAGIVGIQIDGKEEEAPSPTSPDGAQRIGVGVAIAGDGNSKTFRIPGLATTNKGTLIGVYDMRYDHGRDLPGDIDVGMSRSTDGGQSWEPLKVVMDMGNDAKWGHDGIGDPAVLVDRTDNRIWIAGVWSHGNRGWHGSGQGMTPEETGQMMLVHSDDDGVTWSKPINITDQVKKPEWHFLLQGPGKGITMKDGTLVFPTQYQDADKRADGSKKGTPFSSLMYSKDHGESWHMGAGIKANTTEAQVIELRDGSLMLNCRDDRGGARTIGVTKDFGQTWELHPTDRKALNEPVCMASLIRIEHPKYGDLLFFSNPNTTQGRSHMTVKVSRDEGMSWPEEMQTLYDIRECAGYSCLTRIDELHIGVLYEGPSQIYFQRFAIKELIR